MFSSGWATWETALGCRACVVFITVSYVAQDLCSTSPNPKSVAPVAYQVILEPGIGQFREFESPRVHTGKNS